MTASSPWNGAAAALDLVSDQLSAVAAPLGSLSGTLGKAVEGLGAGSTALGALASTVALPADIAKIRAAWRETPTGHSRVAASFAASSGLLKDLSTLTALGATLAPPLSPVQIGLAVTAATLAFAGGIATVTDGVRKMTADAEGGSVGDTGGDVGDARGGRRAGLGRAGPGVTGVTAGSGTATSGAAHTIRALQGTVDGLRDALKRGREGVTELTARQVLPAKQSLDAALQGSADPVHRNASTALDEASTQLQRTMQALGAAETALGRYRATI